MSDSDREEAVFRQMVEQFLHKMVTVHGFTYEEARMVVGGELQREHDARKTQRRSNFGVIRGDRSS